MASPIPISTAVLFVLAVALELYFKEDVPWKVINPENGWLVVVTTNLFINYYNISKSSIFLMTMGMFARMVGKELNFESPLFGYVVYGLFGLGFFLQFPQMPLKCKLYTAATVGALTYSETAAYVMLHFTVLLFFKRLFVLVMTIKTSFAPTFIFNTISHLAPMYSFSKYDFFRADDPPEEVAICRESAFDRMQKHWDTKWPKSLAMSAELRKSFSDLRFAAGNRVFLPFKKILDDWCDPFTVSTHTERMNLVDLDGHSQLDIAGSYGVNVAGYDRYKQWITEGWDMVKGLGCVLGPVHPVLLENIEMLKKVSGHEEVSFHMSGTEAVMAAVRLARFNKKKPLVVMFAGAYHGWWDGVQTTAGNERFCDDALTLKDLAESSLNVIKLRAGEIAAVMVNPLQAFHANSPPPSDVVLASDNRAAGTDTERYSAWLQRLKKICADYDIVLIFDEVYTGFRLAPGGAQAYFKTTADMVCYGKTLGGGIANGVVCSSSALMNRCDPVRPARLAYVIGTFAGHPLLLATMNRFLKWATTQQAADLYKSMEEKVLQFVITTNKALEAEDIPLRCASYATVWTMLFQQPGRYHWILQYYLKDEGINLSWVGTGRLNFSLDFEEDDLAEVTTRLLSACRRMKEDGWWWYDPTRKGDSFKIKAKLGKEFGLAFIKSSFGM